MKHLTEKTKKFITDHDGPTLDKDRIEFIQKDFWIPYPAAMRIYKRMEDILAYPRVYRMPHLLIVAHSNNGKTSILNRFLKQNQAYAEDGNMFAPVLACIMPERTSERRFAESVLQSIDIHTKSTDGTNTLIDKLFRTLRKVKCKVLVIDEVHQLASGSPSQMRFVMNLMKNLSTLLGISIIAAGTTEGLNLFSADDQLANRFKPLVLPKWKGDDLYLQLLMSFEKLVPLKDESRLANSVLASYVLDKTDGTIGDIIGYLKEAACYAISKGQEKISKDSLDNCGYQTVQDIEQERRKL